MATGKQLYDLATPHVGEKYVFGVVVPKDDKGWDGPWDCAELASWLVYQLTSLLYGCSNNTGHPSSADAYSGFWARDATYMGEKITVEEAAKIPGAALVRIAGKNIIGHVVISNGAGGTIEAHSTKSGVITSTISNRRWDYGILVPWIEYPVSTKPQPPLVNPGKIYRWTSPLMKGEKVKEIQRALGTLKVDGVFGPKTFNAVRLFQRNTAGLVADGEVGPLTASKLGISF